MGFLNRLLSSDDVGLSKISLVVDIKDNLSFLLNSHSYLHERGFGFVAGDAFSANSRDIVQHLGTSIYNIIRQFEPRVDVCNITYFEEGMPFVFCYILQCKIYETKEIFEMRVMYYGNGYCRVL